VEKRSSPLDKTISILNLSQHAVRRMAQRNISLSDLEYVLEHGERLHKTGVTIYVLRKRDIPQSDRKRSKIARLEGTVVLTGFFEDGSLEIITVYRDKSAFRSVQCKVKYDNRRKYRTNGNPLGG
jgi:uncharacterized protein DUF4258